MKDQTSRYIWSRPGWQEALTYDIERIQSAVDLAAQAQAELCLAVAAATRPHRMALIAEALDRETMGTCEIEGVSFQAPAVHRAIAQHLDPAASANPATPPLAGIAKVVVEASRSTPEDLSAEQILEWQACLFPSGLEMGMDTRISAGVWRDDAKGPMQVVSGRHDNPSVHFQAPPAQRIPAEMDQLLAWINGAHDIPVMLQAGIAHLRFLTIHPFDDGNGRIARAISACILARSLPAGERHYYSVAHELQRNRKGYYGALETAQKGTGDITAFLEWFLDTVIAAIARARSSLDSIKRAEQFWARPIPFEPASRQGRALTKILDGFDGRLTARKWAALCKCSLEQAKSDLDALLRAGVLREQMPPARHPAYELAQP